MFPFPTFNPSNPYMQYVDAWQNPSTINASTYTLPNFSLGKASTRKRVYALFSWSASGSRTLNSVTIAGVAATKLISARSSASTNVEIWSADVSVDSGDITLTWSGAIYGFSIGVYAAFELNNGSVLSSNSNYISSSSSSVSTTVDTVPGAFVLAVDRFESSNAVLSYTNVVNDTPALTYTVFGHDFSPPTETGRTITGSSTNSTSGSMIAVVVISK